MRESEIKQNILSLSFGQMESAMKHIVERHITISDADLQKRISNGKRIATKFDIQKNEIINCMIEAIQNEEYDTPACITEWLEDVSDNGDFYVYKDFNYVVGHGYFHDRWHDWKKGPLECSAVFVVLRKYNTYFQVITAFPYITKRI